MTTTAIILAAVGLGIFLHEWLSEPPKSVTPLAQKYDYDLQKAHPIQRDFYATPKSEPTSQLGAPPGQYLSEIYAMWLARIQAAQKQREDFRWTSLPQHEVAEMCMDYMERSARGHHGYRFNPERECACGLTEKEYHASPVPVRCPLNH